ncbi:Cytochrome P450 6a2 [Eumeta japonica]|uniref:unspecific monooxygenase n=2 Tax=Eumeta variegata TaxID=151549 RepID=A0A4C1Z647_EUMVA|nr:Cytochrome P450 6a2 [Eumeta japonica]
MAPIVVERSRKLVELAGRAAATGGTLGVKDMIARYTTDFIGACGYEIDANSLNDENSHFRRLGKRVFTVTFRDAVVIVMKLSFPRVIKHLNVLAPEIENPLKAIIQGFMKERAYEPSKRNDFIDFLLELKVKGNLVGESIVSKTLSVHL